MSQTSSSPPSTKPKETPKPHSGPADITYRKMNDKELQKFNEFKKKDNSDKENLSRGVIGLVKTGSKISDGTLHDRVNTGTRKITDVQKGPTEQDLETKIKEERRKGLTKSQISEEFARALRIKQQGFPYKCPPEFEGVPGLESDNIDNEKDESNVKVNREQGEELVSEEQLQSQSQSQPKGLEEVNQGQEEQQPEEEVLQPPPSSPPEEPEPQQIEQENLNIDETVDVEQPPQNQSSSPSSTSTTTDDVNPKPKKRPAKP